MRLLLGLAAIAASHAALAAQGVDPINPTCPRNPGWAVHPQMRFTEREVEGRRVLLAEGAIDGDLLARLEAALRDRSIDEVWLRSTGGDARIGNRAGLLLRQHRVRTRIPPGWACAGACAFTFLGGTVRTVEPGGLFIVQATQMAGEGSAGVREQESALLATEDYDYLIRMGVSRTLLTDIVHRMTDPRRRRCLTPAQLARYDIVTDPPRR